MRRLVTILCVAIASFKCAKSEKTAPTAGTRSSPAASQCAAAVLSGAQSEIRLLIIGVGFPKASTDFEAKDVETTCGSFTRFQTDGYAPAKASLLTQSVNLPQGTSLKDLSIDTNSPCPFQYTCKTLKDVASHAPAGFSPTHYAVVVGSDITHNYVNVGCSDGTTMFLPSGVKIGTIVHEMGHAIGGLYDEYSGRGPFIGKFTDRNCSTDIAAFVNQTGAQGQLGCNRYDSGIYHPTNNCRMLDPTASPFDKVCSTIIQSALDAPAFLKRTRPSPALAAPWKEAHEATKGLDVLAVTAGSQIEVLSVTPASIELVHPQVVTGDWFAVAVTKSGTIVAAAPIAAREGEQLPPARRIPYTPRQSEGLFVPAARLVRFTLVGLDQQSVSGKSLELRLVHVPGATHELIVSNAVVSNLGKLEFATTKFNLQKALEEYFSLH